MKIYKIAQETQPYSVTAYHGTIYGFEKFDRSTIGLANDFGTLGKGFYFTLDPYVARSYANSAWKRYKGADRMNLSPQVLTVQINLQNAMQMGQRTMRNQYDGETPVDKSDSMTNEFMSRNIDGAVLTENNNVSEVVVFDPSKITITKRTPLDMSDVKIRKRRR
jgi:hypothetical protein